MIGESGLAFEPLASHGVLTGQPVARHSPERGIVPEDVRRERLRDVGLLRVQPHQAPEGLHPQARAVAWEEERRFVRVAQQLRAAVADVAIDGLGRATDERDDTVLPPLPFSDDEETLSQLDVGQIQPLAFPDPEAEAVEEFEDGAGALAAGWPGPDGRADGAPALVTALPGAPTSSKPRAGHGVGATPASVRGGLRHVVGRDVPSEPNGRDQTGSWDRIRGAGGDRGARDEDPVFSANDVFVRAVDFPEGHPILTSALNGGNVPRVRRRPRTGSPAG